MRLEAGLHFESKTFRLQNVLHALRIERAPGPQPVHQASNDAGELRLVVRI